MKRRINVTDQALNKLVAIAAELNVNGAKQNEKVEKLFNENILFEKMEECAFALDKCKNENNELQKEKIHIDEDQLKRINKLQAIGILENDFSESLKMLVDSFVEVKADKIKEMAMSI